jgi:putative DNA primase/helicase
VRWGSSGTGAAHKEAHSHERKEQDGLTVIDAIRALNAVCDGATSKDGAGFSKFDREEHEDLINKAINDGYLSPKEENAAYRLVKKYTKQLKKLGIDYNEIGHIIRDEDDSCDGLAKINDRIPAWIEEYHFKTVTDTEKLYHYAHGVYLDDGETVLKALIEREFGDISDNRMVADVIGKVKRRTYIDRDLFNNRPILNVQNGLLDLMTLELKPHTPDYLSTAQINATYRKDAKAPRIQEFLKEVAKSGDIELIEEIIGWLLWPDYNVHKAVMFIGIGRNGKGTLLRLMTALLGKKSISNVTLQDLVADRFAKADLYGKLANIGGDLPSKDLSDTAAFRNLTGGDDNRAQEKYRPAFSFRNKAKMAFSANVLPRSPDDTYAFYARWILLEFLKVFDPQKGTGDPDLDAKLQTPEELSGLLNIALAGLARLRANGWKFSYDKTVEDVEVMYKRNANPVYAFLLDECETGKATDYIEKNVFYSCFKDYATSHGIRPLSSKKFSELLKDQTEVPVSSARPGSGWDRPLCWQGIKFKEGSESKKKINGVTSSKSSVTPTPSSRGNEGEERREEEKREEGRVGITKTHDFDDAKEPDASEKIRIAAMQEYGISGWVDPRKISAKLHIELEKVTSWLEAQSNYVRTPSGNGYTQRSKAEAA